MISAARAKAARPVIAASLGSDVGEVPEPAVQCDPSAALDQAERVALVMAALQDLPMESREILVLRDVERPFLRSPRCDSGNPAGYGAFAIVSCA